MSKRIFLFSVLLLTAAISEAKDDQSIWVSNTIQTDFGGSRYLSFFELQPRFNDDSTRFAQLIVRPFIGYKLTDHLQVWLGYAWQGEYNSKDKFDLATDDIIQQVQWIDNITPAINFQYRFRLEQRFFEDTDLSHRMRHRFRFQYNVPESKLYVVAFDELFVYFNSVNHGRLANSVQTGVNQNRSYLGIGYKITPHINMDTGYQLQYVNNFGKADLFNHTWLTNINLNF